MNVRNLFAIAVAVMCISGGAGITIDSVDRTLDLTTNLARGQAVLVLSGGPARSFEVAFKHALASIHASQGDARLKVSSAKATSNGASYTIDLAEPLTASNTVTVTVRVVFLNALTPYPTAIQSQRDVHLVHFHGTLHYYSPYTIKSESLIVKLQSSQIESKTEDASAKVDGEKITYGPFTDVPAYSSEELKIHYRNGAPFVVAESVRRHVDIGSGWGSTTVEEHLKIRHNGATFKGAFSRLDAQRQPPATMVQEIIANLPVGASQIYFRDSIGNISSSHVDYNDNATVVRFGQRFPLFGGWKTEFYYGYDVPTKTILQYEGGHYYVRFPLASTFPNVLVKSLEVTAVLPSGASGYKVKVNGAEVQFSETRTKAWNNWAGRPTLTFNSNDVIYSDNTDVVEIVY
jgi:oligosaccharyltransferase complex subunit alpha (ribophorin I)